MYIFFSVSMVRFVLKQRVVSDGINGVTEEKMCVVVVIVFAKGKKGKTRQKDKKENLEIRVEAARRVVAAVSEKEEVKEDLATHRDTARNCCILSKYILFHFLFITG